MGHKRQIENEPWTSLPSAGRFWQFDNLAVRNSRTAAAVMLAIQPISLTQVLTKVLTKALTEVFDQRFFPTFQPTFSTGE